MTGFTCAGTGRARGVVDAFDAFARQQPEATAAQLGDLFAYNLKEPVTIRKNQSALVPILGAEVEADKVSLWNPWMGARPLRAVWLTNATGLTLDGGSVSIIDGQAFSGEGLMEPLKAGEKRLLSYAADLGLFVDAKGENVPTRTTKVRIANGLIIQETEERQARTYTAQRGHRAARARARASRPGRLDSRQRFESGRVDGDLAPLPRADPCEDDRDLHR